jgi:hypothetical protein
MALGLLERLVLQRVIGLNGGHRISPGQPTMQVDIGTTPRAERSKELLSRLAAYGTGLWGRGGLGHDLNIVLLASGKNALACRT